MNYKTDWTDRTNKTYLQIEMSTAQIAILKELLILVLSEMTKNPVGSWNLILGTGVAYYNNADKIELEEVLKTLCGANEKGNQDALR